MSWQLFLIEVIRSAAWPIVALTAIILFKTDIRKAIIRIKSLAWSKFQINFHEEVLGVQRFTWSEDFHPLGDNQQIGGSGNGPFLQEVREETYMHPEFAVTEAWRQVRVSLSNLVKQSVDDTSLHGRSAQEDINLLQNKEILGKKFASALKTMLTLRDQVVHRGISPTSEDALTYVDASENLLDFLDHEMENRR